MKRHAAYRARLLPPITYRTIFGGECGKMNQIEIVTAVGTQNPPLSPNIYINRINISYLI